MHSTILPIGISRSKLAPEIRTRRLGQRSRSVGNGASRGGSGPSVRSASTRFGSTMARGPEPLGTDEGGNDPIPGEACRAHYVTRPSQSPERPRPLLHHRQYRLGSQPLQPTRNSSRLRDLNQPSPDAYRDPEPIEPRERWNDLERADIRERTGLRHLPTHRTPSCRGPSARVSANGCDISTHHPLPDEGSNLDRMAGRPWDPDAVPLVRERALFELADNLVNVTHART